MLIAVVATTAYPTGSKVDAGPSWVSVADAGELEKNVPVRVIRGDAKMWVVRLGTGEVLALSSRDAHPNGCMISWRSDFEFDNHTGWFRELCLGSTYALNGVKIFGPSPRGMDRWPARVYGNDVQVYLGPKTLITAPGGLEPYVPRR